MLISVFAQEYNVDIPTHITDKIGDDAAQQVIKCLLQYAIEEGKSTGVAAVHGFMRQVTNHDRPIFPYMGQTRVFGITAFRNTSGWDQHTLGKLCRELAQALVDTLPAEKVPRRPRRKPPTSEQPTL